MTPAAVVPMHTPEEAIEEATYAVRELGLKVIMIANHVRRPVPAVARGVADAAQVRTYVDSLGLESPYDYDPFWAACVELKVAVTAHSGSMGWNGPRVDQQLHLQPHRPLRQREPRLRQGADPGRRDGRFPQLRFALLEGGVGWACNLLTDLVGHWEKRSGREAMESQVRPDATSTCRC